MSKAQTAARQTRQKAAQSSTAPKGTVTSSGPGFLPASLVLWLKTTAWRSLGAAVFAGGLAIMGALLSFDPEDPTLNHITDGAVTNWLGAPGATVADILIQPLGLVSLLLPVTLLFWGGKLMRAHWLPYFLGNLAAMPVGLALLAIAFAVPQPGDGFFLQAGYGGALGQLGYGAVMRLSQGLFILPEGAWFLAFFLTGLPLWLCSLAITHAGWWRFFSFIAQRVKDAATALVAALSGLIRRRRQAAASPTSLARSSIARTDRTKKPVAVSEAEAPVKAPRLKVTKKAGAKGGREALERQGKLDLGDSASDFDLPALDLLSPAERLSAEDVLTPDALENNARLLEGVLEDFSVKGTVGGYSPGPVVTLYELEPAPGTKTARVISLSDDIARSMSAVSARVAVVTGRNAIGIELPNFKRETVFLRELLASRDFEASKARLPLVLGKDIGGAPVVADLATMPHLLVAGTTGSGKSVGINAMILSLLYRYGPDELKLIMVDPKMLELSMYDDIPHLLTPVVTEAKKAVVALKWAVREMEERYRMMQKLGVKNQAGFNKKVSEAKAKDEPLIRRVQTGFDPGTGEPLYEQQEFDFEPLPYLVIVIDEMADLMLVAGKDVESTIQRLAQMARAAGIHVIMATQRPSVDVITGTIKANFPTRISFQVTSKIDSRTILGEQGAEQLLGMGDMLYMAGGGRITRVHGAFVTDNEVDNVVAHIKKQRPPSYMAEVTEEPPEGFDSDFIPGPGGGAEDAANSLYDQAVAIVIRDRRPTTSYIQRRLKIGYNKAATLIEDMEEQGVISAPNHKGQRDVLVPDREEGFE